MLITYQAIINEINQIPIDDLPEFYQILHTYQLKHKKAKENSKKILQFAGDWSEFSDRDYLEISTQINITRTELFK
jgi:hypothetical protein